MQIAFSKAFKKFIDFSGLVEVLVAAEVLAAGSANSFLDSSILIDTSVYIHCKFSILKDIYQQQMLDKLLQVLLEKTLDQAQSVVNERIA